MAKPFIRLLIGPTASGKSAVAHRLARETHSAILSVDSMKIYRRLDIGVAKPSAQEKREVPYHLIDWKEPWESCSVAEWLGEAERLAIDAAVRGTSLIAEGGTSMYIRALMEGLFSGPGRDDALRLELEREAEEKGLDALRARLRAVDPEAEERIFPGDIRRVVRALEVHALTGKPITSFQTQWGRKRNDLDVRVVGLTLDRARLYRRIDERVDRMLERGWIDECRQLMGLEKPLSGEASQALGYRTLFAFLRGEIERVEARDRICFDTHHFARRQLGWFRRFEDVKWIEMGEGAAPEKIAEEVLRRWKE